MVCVRYKRYTVKLIAMSFFFTGSDEGNTFALISRFAANLVGVSFKYKKAQKELNLRGANDK